MLTTRQQTPVEILFQTFYALSTTDQTRKKQSKRNKPDSLNISIDCCLANNLKGNLKPACVPMIEGKVCLIFVTAQEGGTTRMVLPSHCQHHRVN